MMTGAMDLKCGRDQRGFTLIELLLGLAMGMVILAGLTSLFVSYNDASRSVASRTERMGDLYLVSHLMQSGLRESLSTPSGVLANLSARGVSNPDGYPTNESDFTSLPFWHAGSKTLTYQDLEGNVGIFQYQRISNDRIYWLRPLAAGVSGSTNFQELIRNLDTSNGMTVTTNGGRVTVTLASTYVNENKQSKTLSLSFKTWPRN